MPWYEIAVPAAFLLGFILGALAQQWGAEEGDGDSETAATGGSWSEDEKSRSRRRGG